MFDPYCNFCGKDTNELTSTNDDRSICRSCVDDVRNRFCKICGSVSEYYGQRPSEQMHYHVVNTSPL